MTLEVDVAIIGGGIIGASAAYHIADTSRVALLEQESHLGYHSSGRSAALLLPEYGGLLARGLTEVSSGFLAHPPPGFADFPILTKRGALFLAKPGQLSDLDRWDYGAERITPSEARAMVPILDTSEFVAAAWIENVKDIDAAALLQGFIRGARAKGAEILTDSVVTDLKHREGRWCLTIPSGHLNAKVIVNAAGAWADQVGLLAGAKLKGLASTRRTVIVIDPPAEVDASCWPLVSDAAESFYFKPEGGRIAICPGDKSPVEPQDVQADEWDVAVAADRFQAATDMLVHRVVHKWAGIRVFSGDADPIIGFDEDLPEFLWAAGFGGFGIQTAPAAGQWCAALIARQEERAASSHPKLNFDRLSPARFAKFPSFPRGRGGA